MKANYNDNNELTFVPFDINKPYIEITDTEYNDLLNGEIVFENGKLVNNHERKIKDNRIYELKGLLNQTDYKAIKYAEGLITPQEYEPIRIQRQAWRDEINELEQLK